VHYVYILRSIAHPKQIYIGYTHDLKTRLAQHNAGKSAHTSKFAPWSQREMCGREHRPSYCYGGRPAVRGTISPKA